MSTPTPAPSSPNPPSAPPASPAPAPAPSSAGRREPDPAGPLDRLPEGAPLPTADAEEHLDRVVVVGAGPVGLCTALGLARAGVPVTVLEKGPDLATESRASTFHPPTLELLDDLGVVERVVADGLRAPVTQFRDRTAGAIAEFDLGLLEGDTRYPFRIQLEQDKLARIVLEVLAAGTAAGEWDVDVRFSHRAHVAAADTADRVHLLVGTVGGFTDISAPWVVACDGAHSPVRTSLGVDLVGETYPERFLVASVADDLAEVLPGLAHVNYVADPDEWLVLLRTPDHWRVLFPVTDDRPDGEFTEADVQERLGGVAALGRPWQVLQWSLYVVSRRVATTMRVGRVLLAGDAAHQNSPLGGMGMNSGIQDGVSLARRLAAVWHGTSGDDVLDEWDRLRREVATDYVQADSHANWLVLREPDPVRRAGMQDELRDIAADPQRHRERVARTAMLDAVRAHL